MAGCGSRDGGLLIEDEIVVHETLKLHRQPGHRFGVPRNR
jgi:hypothetical protein